MIDEHYKIRNKAVPLVVYCQEGNLDAGLHNHTDFEIILMRGGKGYFQVGETVYTVEAGDLIFVNPMEVHGLLTDKDYYFSHACMCFDCSLILDEKLAEDLKEEEIRISHLVKATQPGCGEMAELVMKIVNCDMENGPYMKMEIISYVSLLFSNLMKNGYINDHAIESKSAQFCGKVLQYISEHYDEQITSREIAVALGYNQSYFCRNFRKNFNHCFSEHLNIYRIAMSRRMMEDGDKNVSQIANACGFRTPAHFSACFKKYIGVLPSVYRTGGIPERDICL